MFVKLIHHVLKRIPLDQIWKSSFRVKELTDPPADVTAYFQNESFGKSCSKRCLHLTSVLRTYLRLQNS